MTMVITLPSAIVRGEQCRRSMTAMTAGSNPGMSPGMPIASAGRWRSPHLNVRHVSVQMEPIYARPALRFRSSGHCSVAGISTMFACDRMAANAISALTSMPSALKDSPSSTSRR